MISTVVCATLMHFRNPRNVNPLMGRRPSVAVGVIPFNGSEITMA